MLSPQKNARLMAFLSTLSGAVAVKLFSAIEADRARGDAGLPHGLLLSSLRTQLLEEGVSLPGRQPDARRLFYTAFEDFFIARHGTRKRQGQIARASLEAIWRLLMTDAALTETAFAAAALDDALREGRDDPALVRAVHLAAEAGLSRLFDPDTDHQGARSELTSALGGEHVYQDLRELRVLLGGVDQWAALRDEVPKASSAFGEEKLYALRVLFLDAAERSPALGGYLLLGLKGRLNKPWRALALYYHLARGSDERLHALRDVVETLPESLFQDIEEIARDLERACSDNLDALSVRVKLNHFLDYSEGLMRQSTRAGDNVFANRIEACREVVGEAHIRFCEQALTSIRAAMPVRHAGGASRLMSLRPDISTVPDPRIIEEARASAQLLVDAISISSRLGEDDAMTDDLVSEARSQVEAYLKDLILEIRAGEDAQRDRARDIFASVITIAEPLLNRDQVGLFRDRAAAAAVAV